MKKKYKLISTIAIILLSFIAISTLFWYFSDDIGIWAMNANPILVTILNLITSPFYIGSLILIIEIFFRSFKLNRNVINYIRVTLASIILSLALDIVTIPHSITRNFIITNSSTTSIYFDTVLGKLLSGSLQGLVGSFILYIIIPLLMVILSLIIASPKTFIKLMKNEVGA